MRAGFERAGDLEAARAVRAEMQAAGMGVRKPAGAPAAYKAPAHPDAYHRRHGKQARRCPTPIYPIPTLTRTPRARHCCTHSD